MPFKSKSQWKACFASKGFGGKVDCEEWAKKTKKFKKLPNKLEMKNEFFLNWLKNRDPEF